MECAAGWSPERATPSSPSDESLSSGRTRSRGSQAPSAARGSSLFREPPNFTVVVRVEQGSSSSPSATALGDFFAQHLRDAARSLEATFSGPPSGGPSVSSASGRGGQSGVLPRCYRCLGRGHIGRWCPSKESFHSRCFGCGQEGHLVRRCALKAHCAPCASRGLPAAHRAGSGVCPPIPPVRTRAGWRRRGSASYAEAVLGARGACPQYPGHNGLDPPCGKGGVSGSGS